MVRSEEFKRVLRRPAVARAEHFAVHCGADDLSTGPNPIADHAVDDRPRAGSLFRLGAVVPKRYARRAVTRAMFKRSIYHRFGEAAGVLCPGLWVVRLCAAFEVAQYRSAVSAQLRAAAAAELRGLLERAALKQRRP